MLQIMLEMAGKMPPFVSWGDDFLVTQVLLCLSETFLAWMAEVQLKLCHSSVT